jgi:hypothetical protein
MALYKGAYCSYRTAKDRSVCYNVDTVRLSKYYKTGTKLENLGERLYFIVEMLVVILFSPEPENIFHRKQNHEKSVFLLQM